MKNRLTIGILLVLITSMASAQYVIGPINWGPGPGHFEPEDLPTLKKSTVTFICRETDENAIKELKRIYKEVWTFSNFDVVSYKDFDEVKNDSTRTFISLAGMNTTSTFVHTSNGMETGRGISYDNTHVSLNLWKPTKTKRGKEDVKYFARIELYPAFKSIYAKMYDPKAEYRNWTTGVMKNNLQIINDYLTVGKERSSFISVLDQKEIKKLKTDTLFIPDYIFIKFNKFSGDETKRYDVKEIMGDYPYKYKVVTAEELSEKILNAKSSLYYLSYIKSSTDKYVQVIDGSTGKQLYSDYNPMSYNMKDNDIKALESYIKK